MRFVLSYWKFENGQWVRVQKTLKAKSELKTNLPKGTLLDAVTFIEATEIKK